MAKRIVTDARNESEPAATGTAARAFCIHAPTRRGEPAFDDVDDPAERDAGLLGMERGPGADIREGATARFPEQCFAIAQAEMDTTHPVGAKRSQPAQEFSQAVQVPQADGNRVGDLIAGNRGQPGVVATARGLRSVRSSAGLRVRSANRGGPFAPECFNLHRCLRKPLWLLPAGNDSCCVGFAPTRRTRPRTAH